MVKKAFHSIDMRRQTNLSTHICRHKNHCEIVDHNERLEVHWLTLLHQTRTDQNEK